MVKLRSIVAAGLIALLTSSAAFAQAQVGAGQLWGNPTAARAPLQPATVTQMLDRALSSTRGAILERGASGWGVISPSATAGLPFVSNGTGNDPAYQVLGTVGGGTGLATYAIGDIIYASSSSVLARLADVATGNALISGGVGVAPAWGKITSSHLNITPTTCTNQFVTAISATGTATCATITLSGAAFANQGTTTTVLHGNAAGNPTFAQVSLTADITGTLGVGNGGTGGAAASGTLLDNITGFSGTGFVKRTGAGAYSFIADPLPVANGGTGGSAASGTLLDNITGFSSLGYIKRNGAGTYVFATAATSAQYVAGAVSGAPVEPNVIYQAETTTTYGATTTFDFSTFINTAVTLTGNIATQTLTNVTAGKSGTIAFIQDATGSRTSVFNSIFKFPSGVVPTLSTTANAVDILSYSCRSATNCPASLLKDVR